MYSIIYKSKEIYLPYDKESYKKRSSIVNDKNIKLGLSPSEIPNNKLSVNDQRDIYKFNPEIFNYEIIRVGELSLVEDKIESLSCFYEAIAIYINSNVPTKINSLLFLGGLKNLKTICLSGGCIGNQMIISIPLESLNIKILDLQGTHVSKECVKQLRERCANIEIFEPS